MPERAGQVCAGVDTDDSTVMDRDTVDISYS